MGRRTLPAIVVLTALASVLMWTDAWPGLRGPAPWPPEWQWIRRTEPTSREPWAALAAGAVLVALVGARDELLRRRGIVAFGALAGLVLHLGLLQLEPRGAWRTLARNTSDSSYHRVALATAGEDLRTFLRAHAERLPQWTGRDRHAATHPPGPVLVHRAVLALAGDERAGVLAAGLLFTALALAAAFPLASLARAAEADAVRTALLWTLLPGPAVLAGQMDPAIALPVTLCAAALVRAFAQPAWAIGAGAAAAAALQMSYGAAVFVAFAVVVAWAVARPARRDGVRALALAGAVGLLLTLAPALAGHDVLGAARTALRIHREEYTAGRSYVLWLPWNVLDLALFLGVPVAVLLATAGSRVAGAALAALAVLLVSGTVRGEAGRIWSPLMPLLLAAALAGRRPTRAAWTVLAAALLLLAFVLRASWHVF